jgi:hypothetical protein
MKYLFLLYFSLHITLSWCQYYGNNIFTSLTNLTSAKSNGTGYSLIGLRSDDLSYAIDNPALLTSDHKGKFLISNTLHPAGVNQGILAYAFSSKSLTISPIIKYSAFGEFIQRDENGIETGEFSALDYSVGLSLSKEINPYMAIGASGNFMGSYIENYYALGFGGSFGAFFMGKSKLFSGSILAKNIGFKFKDYTNSRDEVLPLNVQIGISYKLKHAPFRFSLLLNELNRWNNMYTDPSLQPEIDALTGDEIPVDKLNFIEKFGHHVVLQVELLASKNFQLRSGFDYHRRNELVVDLRPGMAGFSLGMGINIKKVIFNYGFTVYSKAASFHTFSIATTLKKGDQKAAIMIH